MKMNMGSTWSDLSPSQRLVVLVFGLRNTLPVIKDENAVWDVVSYNVLPKEAIVLELRCGKIPCDLSNRRNYSTLKEVGAELRLSSERIRQIEAKALRKLRHPSRSRILRELIGKEVKR